MSDTKLRERLAARILAKHGGTGDPWRDHWNLTENDSELHRDALAALAEALSEAQPARAHRFGELLCRLLECDALGDAADNMPEALLNEWQTATEEHIDSTAGKHAQPAPKAPETPSELLIDAVAVHALVRPWDAGANMSLGYRNGWNDAIAAVLAINSLKAAQADQSKSGT